MKLLLDANAVIFLLNNDVRLGQKARDEIMDSSNAVHISSLTMFELAVKIRIGKLAINLTEAIAMIDETAIQRIEIEDTHCIAMSKLVSMDGHKDPYDLMLIAQGIVEGMTIVTSDGRFASYPVNVMSCENLAVPIS